MDFYNITKRFIEDFRNSVIRTLLIFIFRYIIRMLLCNASTPPTLLFYGFIFFVIQGLYMLLGEMNISIAVDSCGPFFKYIPEQKIQNKQTLRGTI